MVDLSFNSTKILDFFMFWNCKLQNRPKNLGLNCHWFTYLALKGYCIHTRDCSQFWSNFKTRKRQGLSLSCNTIQLSTWAHKCHFNSDPVNFFRAEKIQTFQQCESKCLWNKSSKFNTVFILVNKKNYLWPTRMLNLVSAQYHIWQDG